MVYSVCVYCVIVCCIILCCVIVCCVMVYCATTTSTHAPARQRRWFLVAGVDLAGR